MCKRFTDTEKWRRPWFRKLSPTAKLAWMFLVDNCDHAGVWVADFELLSFQVGVQVNESNFIEWFGDKIVRVDSDKFFVPSFVEFQYDVGTEPSRPKLSPTNKAHLGVIRALERVGVDASGLILQPSPLEAPTKPLDSPCQGAQEKEKEQEQEKEQEKDSSSSVTFDFEPVYSSYPRRKGGQGKKKALEFCRKNYSTAEKYQRLGIAVSKYKQYCASTGKEGSEYVMQFLTFVRNAVDEWAEMNATTSSGEYDWSKVFGAV